MKVKQVLNCSFTAWYSTFKDVTWNSISIPLPQQFIDYLHEDSVVLPEETNNQSSNENHFDDDDENDQTEWNDDSLKNPLPSFPDLDAQIKEAIQKLGGYVFPKLNWSSPKDAAWIALNNSLKCCTPNDVYLLLKSSEFVSHDLNQPFKDCDDFDISQANCLSYFLTLRQWIDVNPGTEFRCFIGNNRLIGISQRDYTNFYPYLDLEKHSIVNDIKSSFEKHVKDKFVDSNYVMDVYKEPNGFMKIIDFNPFGPTTDPLLFEWDELTSNFNDAMIPIFRYVKDEFGIQPSTHRHYSLPLDFVQLSRGEDPFKLVDFLKLQSRGPAALSSDEEEM